MRRLVLAAVVVPALMWPTAASAYSFGNWASDNGYSSGAVFPNTVRAGNSSIDSLDGIGDFNWTTTPTTRLFLEGNQLSSIESGDFSGLTNLENLRLNDNQISSIESGDFSGPASLTRLQLINNQIASIESGDFSGLTNLELLTLEGNQLSSIDSGDFSGLTNLRFLLLGGNQLSSIESGDFSGLTNLEKLALDDNQISSIEPGDFSGLTNLEDLVLSENPIASIESGDFSGLTNLKELQLTDGPLASIESGDFSGLTNMGSLYLYGNQLSSIESGAFSGMTNLVTLSLYNNQLSNIESGVFSGLANLRLLWLHDNASLTELNLAEADFSSLTDFHVGGNVNITSVSLRNAVVNQTSLEKLLLTDGSSRYGIGELAADITEMDLSGIDYGNITDLGPLYVMDDLTDLWLVDTVNLNASDLDVLLDNLATIEGTASEGILHMTQANYDAFNTAGGDLLATWDSESGHHVEFVEPGDFNGDGVVDGADFLKWQRDTSVGALADWEANYGMGASLSATSATVPEPTTCVLALVSLCLAISRRRIAAR
jgi:Leucine-rich repeat (LRR) protein